jgi:hypothetical protein
MGQQVRAICRWSTGGSADRKRKGGNQGDTPKGKHGGGESLFRRCLTPVRVLFVFSSFYLSLGACKHCLNQLGIRIVLGT